VHFSLFLSFTSSSAFYEFHIFPRTMRRVNNARMMLRLFCHDTQRFSIVFSSSLVSIMLKTIVKWMHMCSEENYRWHLTKKFHLAFPSQLLLANDDNGDPRKMSLSILKCDATERNESSSWLCRIHQRGCARDLLRSFTFFSVFGENERNGRRRT
jgi:hypothetical protein